MVYFLYFSNMYSTCAWLPTESHFSCLFGDHHIITHHATASILALHRFEFELTTLTPQGPGACAWTYLHYGSIEQNRKSRHGLWRTKSAHSCTRGLLFQWTSALWMWLFLRDLRHSFQGLRLWAHGVPPKWVWVLPSWKILPVLKSLDWKCPPPWSKFVESKSPPRENKTRPPWKIPTSVKMPIPKCIILSYGVFICGGVRLHHFSFTPFFVRLDGISSSVTANALLFKQADEKSPCGGRRKRRGQR